MKVKSESQVAQLYPTLSDPMDCSLPGFSVHRIFQAKVLEWGAIAFSDQVHRYLKLYISSNFNIDHYRESYFCFRTCFVLYVIKTALAAFFWKKFLSYLFPYFAFNLPVSLYLRDGMGREEGGGFRMGNTCIPVADSF